LSWRIAALNLTGSIAFGVSRLRGQYAVPIKDPYLVDSLRFRQPQ